MSKTETHTGFNYIARAYRQAEAHPGFWDYVDKAVKGVRRYFTIRAARRELAHLPDRLLEDMGIARGDIDDAVTYGRRRDHNRAA